MRNRPRTTLESQLTLYSTTAQSRAASKSGSQWKKQLPVFATAVTSALAMTTGAHAEIIYSGERDINASVRVSFTLNSRTLVTHFQPGANRFSVAGKQFGIKANRTYRTDVSFNNSVSGGPGARLLQLSGGRAQRLSSGAKISAGAGIFGANPARLDFPPTTSSHFHYNYYGYNNYRSFFTYVRKPGGFSNGPGFVGLELGQGATARFGWLDISTGPLSVTATSWAYETVAGQSIKAGQTVETAPTIAPTPEPASLSLMMLAAGAGGVLAWRKRRTSMALAA